ncbi:hypothetical protein [Paenibacillus sp. FSL W7-1287]|uniref:hypothetical protein n=1 Tax=Paenibacillus sp. FSL W7-1287 TaxID=2954538 RepID=UPI0030FA6482
MKKKLPINTSNIIKTYSYHAYISSILLDDKMDEEPNVWFSDIKISNNGADNIWYERQITENNSLPEIEFISEVSLVDRNNASCSQGDISALSDKDNFNFIYSKLKDTGSIQVKIDHIKNTGVWSKAGLMLRETIECDSKYVFIFATPSVNGIVIQKRVKQGEVADYQKVSVSSFPIWLKIERIDNCVNIYCGSKEGEWDYVTSVLFEFSRELCMGLALCSTKENAYLDWYATNYIQMYCYKDFNIHLIPIDFNVGPHKSEFYSFCPYLEVQNLTYSLIESLNQNIIDLVIRSIDDGNYIDVQLDEFYVPNRENFGKRYFIHTNMIYGYDNSDKTFDILGYAEGNVFRSSRISYYDFERAFYKGEDSQVTLIKPHNHYSYNFNLSLVKQQLSDYMYAIDSFSCFNINRNVEPNIVHGVEVYDYLIVNLPIRPIDLRPLHLIYEHKKMMLLRLEYFRKNELISEDLFEFLFAEYKSLEKLSLVSRNLQLKNAISPSSKNMDKIINNLKMIKCRELELIPVLINGLCQIK